MQIRLDDLTGSEVIALLEEHLQNMHQWSPPESVHALDLGKLRSPDITFWTAWQDGTLMGCGALKEIDERHGEIKSMRTPSSRRRSGAGRAILMHIIQEAERRGYATLSLETGTQPGFVPARALYESVGFRYCGPFGSYSEDPYSAFMQLNLGAALENV
jgi:putative acetyltransferase